MNWEYYNSSLKEEISIQTRLANFSSSVVYGLYTSEKKSATNAVNQTHTITAG